MANRIIRSRSPSAGRTRTKRATQWAICSVPTGFSTAAAASKVIAVLVPSSTLRDLVPFTITRTIGSLSIQSDQVAANESQIGAVGAGVVNDVAGALGITGLPGPATNCGWPGWFMHRFFTQAFMFISAVGVDARRGVEYTFDSRAQRKVESEQDIVFMVENFDAIGGLQFALSFRMLIKAG